MFSIQKLMLGFTALSLVSCMQLETKNQVISGTPMPDINSTNSANQFPGFKLTSSLLAEQQPLPDSLKCQRDGGSGQSPPLQWGEPPAGTQSFAIIMHHYPKDTVPGVNPPSHYWLVWNLPGDLRALEQGNPQSIGTEGSDKDGKAIGYTPPCSPAGGGTHAYTITVYALSQPPASLGDQDRLDVSWESLTQAISGSILASSQMTFIN